MAKIRLYMTCVITEYSLKWIIDNEPDDWDTFTEVELDVNEFKRLAEQANDKDELASLIMDYAEREEDRKEYNEFVENILRSNRIER